MRGLLQRHRTLLGEGVRFGAAGGANTLLTLIAYWLLLPHAPYAVAYSVSFALGVVTGYALNTWFVFRAPWSWKRMLAYPWIQVLNYIVGIGLLALFVRGLHIDARVAPVLVICTTLPLTFFLVRRLIKRKPVNAP